MIGPVIDGRSLGFGSTLAAMKVENNHLEQVEEIISRHPGVSHGYERDHQFNIWFTLSVPPDRQVEAELEKIQRTSCAETLISLPVIKLFKIGAFFDLEGSDQAAGTNCGTRVNNQIFELAGKEKSIFNEIQQDLPLVPSPFNGMAERAGVELELFLDVCRSLLEKGIIRRFSASINHRQAGFAANGMACFRVPSEEIEAVGAQLAKKKEVSHCYERKTNQFWPYNLFAMIHGHTKDSCQKIVNEISRERGLKDFALLFSTNEFKKTRVKYLL